MGFWSAYLSALLHYWWTLVVVGLGALITVVWPFLPGEVHHLPAESGWVLAVGTVVVAQTLAARRVAQSNSVTIGVGPQPPMIEATVVVTVDNPGIGQTTVTSVLRSGPVAQNTITVSSPSADTTITAKELRDEDPEDEPDDPLLPGQ
jgi:hypothetical protein